LSVDVCPWYTVQLEWPLKKSTSQLKAFTGISSLASFSSNVEWRTVSKALLNSREITMTYGLVRSIYILRRPIITAVEEPVGRNANWSCCVSVGGVATGRLHG